MLVHIIIPAILFAVCLASLMKVFGRIEKLDAIGILLAITFLILSMIVGNVHGMHLTIISACALSRCMAGDWRKKFFLSLSLFAMSVTWANVVFELLYQCDDGVTSCNIIIIFAVLFLMLSIYACCYLVGDNRYMSLSGSLFALLIAFPLLVIVWDGYFTVFLDGDIAESILNRLINHIILPTGVVMYVILIFVCFVWGRLERQLWAMKRAAVMEEQVRLEKMHYLQLQDMQTKTRAIYHDMKNQMDTVAFLMREEQEKGSDNRSVNNIIAQISRQLADVKKIVSTGNSVIDSLVNMKLAECSDMGIEMEIDITIPNSMELNESLMIILLGNSIDNAIEAASRSLKPWIQLSLKYVDGTLLYILKNTCDINELPSDFEERGISTKNIENHGHGVANMKEAISMMGGNVSFEVQGDQFILKAILYNVGAGSRRYNSR